MNLNLLRFMLTATFSPYLHSHLLIHGRAHMHNCKKEKKEKAELIFLVDSMAYNHS